MAIPLSLFKQIQEIILTAPTEINPKRNILIFQELLAEMETHEEIIKMLNNICELVNKDNNKEDVDDEFNLSDEVKPVQTVLYQLWLRLLEWECLLEQHAGPRTRQEVRQSYTVHVTHVIHHVSIKQKLEIVILIAVKTAVILVTAMQSTCRNTEFYL